MLWPDDGTKGGAACGVSGARDADSRRLGAIGPAGSTSAFRGYRFPDDITALAVRWYLRFRLPYADIAELLAERGVHVDASTVYDWVQHFTPPYKDAARPHRQRVVPSGRSMRRLSGWRPVGSMPIGPSTSTAR